MYQHIKEQVKAERNGYFQNHKKYIEDGGADRVKAYSTGTRWEQFKRGEISLEDLKKYAIIREEKKQRKKAEKDMEKLDRIANAGTVDSITIRVEWKRSSVWGYNPTARVDIYGSNGWNHATDSASGCGYDKRSAAVGGALSSMPEMLKILCDMKEAAMENGVEAMKNNCGCASNEPFIAYGAGYGAIPYFEGGVGFSCFDRIFIKAGFKRVVYDESGKNSDYYYYVREAANNEN